MNWELLFKGGITILGGAVGFLFGGWGGLLPILLVAMAIDQCSGLMASYVEGKLSSKVGFKGIFKKVTTLCVVVLAHQIDLAFNTGSTVRDASIFFYIGNELLSFVENAGRMGVPLPAQLVNAVAVLKGKGEGK
jgi:toxin secretion/phage lysis holin